MVAKASNSKELLNASGTTSDIITAILFADSRSKQYTPQLAASLRKLTVVATCRAIYNWVTKNIEYKEDPDGVQFVQSPGYLYWGKDGKGNGQGDCKSMSVFCGSLLQNLGIQYAYRFISQDASSDYHHVFIVVVDENGSLITLDCVDGTFNNPQHYAKVKDVVPPRTAKVAGFGRPNTDGSQNPIIPNTYGFNVKSWDDFLEQWKKEILPKEKDLRLQAITKIVKDTPYIFIDLSASEIRRAKFVQFFNSTVTSAYQLLYSYWDTNACAIPTDLQHKVDQAIEFKKGILGHNFNNRVKPDGGTFGTPIFTEAYLYVWADIQCFRTYGYPIPMLLQKAYNKINLGTDSLPAEGSPYFDLKQNAWIPNGMPAGDFASIDACLPYNGIRFYPVGTPYWSNSAFLIKNRASDATVKKWLANNPMPTTMVAAIKAEYPSIDAYNQSNAYYNNWWETNVLTGLYGIQNVTHLGFGKLGLAAKANGFGDAVKNGTGAPTSFMPKPTIDPKNTLYWIRQNGGIPVHKISGTSPKIGSGVAAIISAVVAAVIALAGFIYKIIRDQQNKKKSEQQVQQALTDYPKDIANSYQTADGCYMEAHNVNGQIVYKKLCPDGTVVDNANPHAPENLPGNIPPNFLAGQSKSTKLLFIFGLLGSAAWLLLSGGRSTKASNN